MPAMNNDMKQVHVDLENRGYDIFIGKGVLEKTASLIPDECLGRETFIIYDKNTYPYVQVIEDSLAGKAVDVKTFGIKGGEQAKSYNGLQELLDWLLSQKITRGSLIMAVGGGVIGDLVGFAASIIMRGIDFIQIPTTVLSQVDSSVGGKTGINTNYGKNLVGSFYQPKAVLCDVGTLSTLSEREVKAGYAEIVKYALIHDLDFFNWLDDNAENLLKLDSDLLSHAIEKSCLSKAQIVSEDEHEKSGRRALLNLGHTFGHALEAAAGYDGSLLHGEAVAIGMVMAFDLSVKMGLCDASDFERMKAHLKQCGFKVTAKEILPALKKKTPQEIVDLMMSDKKVSGTKIGFILVRGIGQAFQSYEVNMDDVLKVVEESYQ